MKPWKIMVACGGTSGHVNPAIAIAQEIKARRPDTEFLFIGTEHHREAELVPRAGFPMKFIEISGIDRRRTVKALEHNFQTVGRYVHAVREVKQIMKDFKPDLVLGTGGYVSAPVIRAAVALHIPTVLHEQNAFAGMVTKLFAGHVQKILLSFPLAKPLDVPAEKTVLTGNPVSRSFVGLNRAEARRQLGIAENATVVLSYGGSLGARKLNESVCDMLRLSVKDGAMVHYHSAGNGIDLVRENLGELTASPLIHLTEYFFNMPEMMAAADVVIARSGAGSVAELEAEGRASVLIPSPNVTENHQYFNARTLSDVNGAVLLEEKDLNGEILYEKVKEIAFNATLKTSMEKAAHDRFHEDTLEKIYTEIEKLLVT